MDGVHWHLGGGSAEPRQVPVGLSQLTDPPDEPLALCVRQLLAAKANVDVDLRQIEHLDTQWMAHVSQRAGVAERGRAELAGDAPGRHGCI